ncbi:hypothetical protein [Streptomyces sp. NBC_00893]|uniref:hypothetical protein n=1 Tax=Streptomyces sp. NBC_00893 TaxID=2975862 RepID=UPI0022577F4C|nr:hypothetical protein [Streptomyces sp. NBC_00893]MCX4851774.1 hypothetical protein [Streptomyces sp. NBC_00893]
MDQVEGRRGDEQHPEGRNGVRQPARLSGSRSLPGFDQDLLDRARFYNDVALAGALWSLERAADA